MIHILGCAGLGRSLLALVGVLGVTQPAAAQQPVRVGDEFQVNTYTTDRQSSPAVSMDADGDFVVAWHSDGSGGTDDWSSIQGRRYGSDGAAFGSGFQVNTFTTSDQRSPSVSANAGGDFVVVWDSYRSGGTDSDTDSIHGQRVSNGMPLGGEFQVNTYTTYSQAKASVSVEVDGDFVVVWESFGSDGTDEDLSNSIQAQRYASDGTALGNEFQVNTYTTDEQERPAVSMDADGDFVVVWESYGSSGTDSSDRSIQGQRYASDGTALGSEFQVNSYTTIGQLYPSVAVEADGDFVVMWDSYGSSGTDRSSRSVQGQRYTSAGAPLGSEFQINTYTTGAQEFPAVSMDATGSFVVVWQSSGSSGTDSTGDSIQGRRYASNGTPVGSEFQANSYTSNQQRVPSVSAGAGGDFVVVWQSNGSGGTDSESLSIQGQRYSIPLFADGFESGDASGWSSVSP